ncbi:MAG: site-specific DNA-methyltransferase, partial [Mesorhizobium sp.]|nr:site-specific DNA-methyltransferase [Mesorhizobium sp.]
TNLGKLYPADCLLVLPELAADCVDTIFCDPPFNLNKKYGALAPDDKDEDVYVEWCKLWLSECNRILKPGGSIFLYNLPKWNMKLGSFLSDIGLDFRHWIAVEHKSSLPIKGRLYPAHYSLLYFSKGRPNTFHRIRTPIETCRHCGGEIKDYGGHRSAMNPNGVSLKDIWTDIPPVRHRKFKPETRTANALSTKLLERVIEISTVVGDMVLDPFGGSGTTYSVCEQRHRHWIGIEIESTQSIIDRIQEKTSHHSNSDFVERDSIEILQEAAE